MEHKIAFFIGSLGGGGAERVFLNLLNEFESQQIPHILILREKRGNYLKYLNPNTEVVEIGKVDFLRTAFRLTKICRSKKVGVLFSTLKSNNILACITGLVLRKKVVIREASTFDNYSKTKKDKLSFANYKRKISHMLVGYLYPKSSAVISISKDIKTDITDQISISPEKIHVINNPIYNNSIPKKGNEKIDEGDEFVQQKKPRIIAVGRLVPVKNFELLIRSFSLIKREKPSCSLTILGEGPQKNALKKLTRELKVEEDVLFLGFTDNPYKYLKQSDLFVLSSNFEGFGNVIVEALSVGLPIVATNCKGGPPEILDYGKYGNLVPVGRPAEMANAILEKLSETHDPLQSINRAKDFSITNIADTYIRLFNSL